jgi:NADPH:quinone reductase-like Zn-dependent oxidoreductase
MKLRHRILSVLAVVLAVAVVSVALVMSHTSPCGPAPVLPAGTTLMNGIVHRCYGSPDVITYEKLTKPSPADDEILVKVRSAAVNPLDWHYLEGTPYLVRLGAGLGTPADPRLGVDFAGTVEAVGKTVTRFKTGDEVFGGHFGSLAEYLVVREERAVVAKPAGVTFEQAAAVPIAAVTALQALRDKAHVHAGQRVLINGASGGVGTFAVQIAKSLGADVTGVCSTKNVAMVRSIGADHVVDYTREDVTRSGQRYDVIIDNVGTHSLLEYRRVLNPKGVYVMVGSNYIGKWFEFLLMPVKGALLSAFVSQKFGTMFADLNKQDLATLADLMQSGKMTPVIDRSYPLSQAADALRYLEAGHARGKVVVSVE